MAIKASLTVIFIFFLFYGLTELLQLGLNPVRGPLRRAPRYAFRWLARDHLTAPGPLCSNARSGTGEVDTQLAHSRLPSP